MPSTDFQSLLSATNVRCYNSAGSTNLLMLSLLQIIANSVAPTVKTDYQSLLSSANESCYNCMAPGQWQLLELALLQIIANNIGSGGGGSNALTCGNYSGGQPTFTPTTTCALALDTSTRSLWAYSLGGWNQLL